MIPLEKPVEAPNCPPPRVLHVCFSDAGEGGAIGARRLHRAMLECGVDSKLLVYRKRTGDKTVIRTNLLSRMAIFLAMRLGKWVLKLEKVPGVGFRSVNLFPTWIHLDINRSDADIVQLHWINNNTISIGEIAKIRKPLVWKLPDMWAFCGAAHYVLPGDPVRYLSRGGSVSRGESCAGLDLEKWLMRYKQWRWRNCRFAVVTPSRWLGECAKNSNLFGQREIYNIANPIDLKRYAPMDKSAARELLHLDQSKKYLLFGGINAAADRRKGFSYLSRALELLNKKVSPNDVELLVMGSAGDSGGSLGGFRVRFLGTLHGDIEMRIGYGAADVVVLPTLADNLPNVVQEGMACGRPCVGFRVGGMPDMVTHKQTGYLAEPFLEEDLAEGIRWALCQDGEVLGGAARRSAEDLHCPEARVGDYLRLYNDLIGRSLDSSTGAAAQEGCV